MTAKSFILPIALTALLALTACTGTPKPPDAQPSHPANPHAADSSLAPLRPGLLADTHVAPPPAGRRTHV